MKRHAGSRPSERRDAVSAPGVDVSAPTDATAGALGDGDGIV